MIYQTKRWTVVKRDGQWRVLDRGAWHDTFESLTEAHTFATQCAVIDDLFRPGGLTHLRQLQTAYVDLLRMRLKERVLSQ